MELLMLGLNHKTAPIEVRERFAVSKQAVRSGLANLNEYEGLSEAVILSTCNRSEVYAVVEDIGTDLRELKQFLFDLTGNEENIDAYLYSFDGEECIRHLFNVASSLDSLVLGEGQILSQVKEAYAMGGKPARRVRCSIRCSIGRLPRGSGCGRRRAFNIIRFR